MNYQGEIIYLSGESGTEDIRRIDMSLAAEETGWPLNYKLYTLREGLLQTVQKTE
jgi:hypothetical protein